MKFYRNNNDMNAYNFHLFCILFSLNQKYLITMALKFPLLKEQILIWYFV